jgi:hypothetical protein
MRRSRHRRASGGAKGSLIGHWVGGHGQIRQEAARLWPLMLVWADRRCEPVKPVEQLRLAHAAIRHGGARPQRNRPLVLQEVMSAEAVM